MTSFLGIDLGGTKIAFALGTAAGAIHARATAPTQAEQGPDLILDSIVQQLTQLEASTGTQANAIGLGLPGLVDPVTGNSLFLPNLPGNWRGTPVAAILQRKTGKPVFLLNDARMATLGQHTFGQPRRDNLLVLTLGTGIGGGLILDGKLQLGRYGAAGEIGHQTIDPTGPLCNCGNRGCLEALASGPALSRRCGGASTRDIAARAKDGNQAMRDAINTTASYIGTGIANALTITGIEHVILTGGLTHLGDLLLHPIQKTVRDRVRMFPTASVKIEFSQLGDDLAVLGGIALASQQHRISQ